LASADAGSGGVDGVYVGDAAAAKLEAAAVNSVEEEKVRVEMAVALHNYHVNTTTWMRLTVWAHLIAVLAIAIENWLVTRGKKPIPRVGVMW
jgi:hypothetical protein